ncbi:MAG TPA: bifunctional precorrin-2 dehydrogenase/sirohydrochlorin ferrochelatase [Bacillota bacterium]|nr:bifunctional precorrin-2 dehydrogenase/sirohydrochlorin ferrochelatase [Bacillota bacterium]
MPDFLPIMVKTTGLPCLVVGGGKIALRKVMVLLRFGASVTVVSEERIKGIAKLAGQGRITWRNKRFSLTDLFGKKLVIAATNHRGINGKIAGWAKILGIPFNCVDDLALSSFIFPAIYRSGPLTIAISTQGFYPAAARQIKREIAANYGRIYGFYLDKLRDYREKIKLVEADPQKRRYLLKNLLQVGADTLLPWNEIDFREWLQHERNS